MIGTIKVGYNWTVAEIDHELGRYLRRLFLRTFGIKLQRPSNKEHITIISEYEKLYDKLPLEKYHKKQVNFKLVLQAYTNGNAFWCPVLSMEIGEIRESTGLCYEPEYGFHFCIGYLNNGIIE